MKQLRFKKFDRQAKLIISGAAAIGSSVGLGCAYVYTVIESLVSSK